MHLQNIVCVAPIRPYIATNIETKKHKKHTHAQGENSITSLSQVITNKHTGENIITSLSQVINMFADSDFINDVDLVEMDRNVDKRDFLMSLRLDNRVLIPDIVSLYQ